MSPPKNDDYKKGGGRARFIGVTIGVLSGILVGTAILGPAGGIVGAALGAALGGTMGGTLMFGVVAATEEIKKLFTPKPKPPSSKKRKEEEDQELDPSLNSNLSHQQRLKQVESEIGAPNLEITTSLSPNQSTTWPDATDLLQKIMNSIPNNSSITPKIQGNAIVTQNNNPVVSYNPQQKKLSLPMYPNKPDLMYEIQADAIIASFKALAPDRNQPMEISLANLEHANLKLVKFLTEKITKNQENLTHIKFNLPQKNNGSDEFETLLQATIKHNTEYFSASSTKPPKSPRKPSGP